MSGTSSGSLDTPPLTATIPLSMEELEVLRREAHYYERSMGVTRFLVRATAPAEVKAKYRFIVEEARSLEQFIDDALQRARDTSEERVPVSFTVGSLIAFWGRLLSTLNVPRSRRKLKRSEAAAREALADKFERAVQEIAEADANSVTREIATRRVREVDWMRSAIDRA